jgi:hypothetical protein
MTIFQVNIRPAFDGNIDPGLDFEIEAKNEKQAAEFACNEFENSSEWVILEFDRYYVEVDEWQIFEAIEEDGGVKLI